MKTLIGLFAAICLVASVADVAKAADDEPSIIVIEGIGAGNGFKMTTEDVARIIPDAIAGSTIKVKVDGKAKAKVYDVKNTGEGPQPIGGSNKEVLVMPTGKGQVKVTITVKMPTEDKPKDHVYKFDVK